MMDGQLGRQAQRDYLENRVFSAHPVERVDLLYQVAIDSVNAAIARLKDGDTFARGHAVTKAHEAVEELLVSLDHSVGSFSRTLAELYVYIQRQLITGHSQRSEQALQEALSVLTTLADAWKVVVERTCGGSSPSNDGQKAPEYEPAPEPVLEVSEPCAAYSSAIEGVSTSRDWSC